jgi:hypothetical protein
MEELLYYTLQLYSHRTGACIGADLPIIASGVLTVKAVGIFFFFFLRYCRKGIVLKEVL